MTRGRPVRIACAVLAMLPLLWCPAHAQVGGELSELERHVSSHPTDTPSRQRLAEAYGARGFVEEAVATYVTILAQSGDDEGIRGRLEGLLAQRMPEWLPPVASETGLFPHVRFECAARDPGGTSGAAQRLLQTTVGFAAQEGGRRDGVHGWHFPLVDYGYRWVFSRWVMSVRAHRDARVDPVTAASALTAIMCLQTVGLEFLGQAAIGPSGQPIDLWITREGEPGARSLGPSIYLYAAHVPRSPAEWLRELAHEYGHTALPGIGGFTATNDPWADGDLGELLFVKWLAGSGQPQPLLWSVAEAEREAMARRTRLMTAAQGSVDSERLSRLDEDGRDYFLGLALRVEEAAGPRFLAEALARCPRGKAGDFITAVEALARTHGVDVWGARDRKGGPQASPPA